MQGDVKRGFVAAVCWHTMGLRITEGVVRRGAEAVGCYVGRVAEQTMALSSMRD